MKHINSISLLAVQPPSIAARIADKNAIATTIWHMNVKDARRRRLGELKSKYGSLQNLAHELNKGKRKPSKYLDRYLSQLYSGSREMGDRFARRMEAAFGKPEGWMDHVGASSVEASELLSIWGQFPPEEQSRILDEMRIRLRVIQDKQHIIQALGDKPVRPPKSTN